MDDQMVTRLLSTYGAPPSAQNVNRAREFFATNPEIAEKRAMGLRGSGIDDNSDVLGAMLDKFMAKADPAPVDQVGDLVSRNMLPIDTVQNASAPTRQSATAAPAPAPAPNRQMNYGPGPSPQRQMNYGPGAESSSGGWLDDLLMSLLGISSVAGRAMMGGKDGGTPTGGGKPPAPVSGPEATYVGPMGGKENDPRIGGYFNKNPGSDLVSKQNPANKDFMLEAPRGRISDHTPDGNYESVGNEVDTVKNRNDAARSGRERQIQAEVDAENAQAQALQDQIMERNRLQKNTRDLSRAARAATGRR